MQRLVHVIRRALSPWLALRADPWLVITEAAIVGPRRRELRKRTHVRSLLLLECFRRAA